MNSQRIFETFNRLGVKYLLIGGMNMLLRHGGNLTHDVDLWIEDTKENRLLCHQALSELDASWGVSDEDWGPVEKKSPDWLQRQGVICLLCAAGAIDIFRSVEGLPSWSECRSRAVEAKTNDGVVYPALCDEDLLKCQLVLPIHEQKQDRIQYLKRVLKIS